MNKHFLIVGLGNFGNRYQNNRHNSGSMFLEYWAQENNLTWTDSPDYLLTQQKTSHGNFFLVRLKTLMNLSGIVLKKVTQQLQIKPNQIMVCADNLDLDVGKTTFRHRLPQNKHNGLINIQMQFVNQPIFSLLFGIGRRKPAADWVLSNFSSVDKKKLIREFKFAKKAFLKSAETLLNNSREAAINNFHHHKSSLLQNQRRSKALILVGGQWGNEGKGKIIDFLADENYPIICRYSGGSNSLHTVIIGAKKYKISALPGGSIRPQKKVVIGSGCFVHLTAIIQEWKTALQNQPDLILKISEKAHLIMPYHFEEDKLGGKERINKTKTIEPGVGPCMQDKINRYGFRVADLKFPEVFKKRLKEIVALKNLLWTKVYNQPPLDSEKIATQLLTQFKEIKNCVTNMQQFFLENPDQNVLFESSQGTLLDLNFGFYPFVASTSVTSNNAVLGLEQPLPYQIINFGIFKAYVSCIGAGPFPTLMPEKTAVKITKLGHERDVSTGGLRKIGWFDAVLANYTIRVNNFHRLALTCLDVLTGITELKIAVAYRINQKNVSYPTFFGFENKIKIQYITLPGWNKPLGNIRNFKDLPENAQAYVKKIEQLLKTKINLISVGPERTQIIARS